MRLFVLFLLLVFNFLCVFGQPQEEPLDTIRIGYYESPPFVMNVQGAEPEGVSIWLWEQITKEIDIPYELVYMPLDSLLQGLSNQEVDMSLNPLTITSQRSLQFDFSPPYYISNATVMVEASTPLQQGLQFLSSFFSINFLRAVLALFVVIFIFGFLAWLFERRANPEEFQPGVKGVWSGIWWSAVTMTTVGYGDKSPQSIGGRIIALIWMFAAIIIISGFTAGIASSLTVNQLGSNRSDINSFKEDPLATVSGSATEEWLKEHFFREVQSFANLDSCQQALAAGEVAAVAYDAPLLNYLAESDSLSRYEVLPLKYNLQLYAFGFSERMPHPLRDQISVELLKVTESTDWEILLAEYGLQKE